MGREGEFDQWTVTGYIEMSSYFTSERRGEMGELRAELNHKSFDVRKSALKKVIAMMTLGKDVSGLFHDVIKCLESQDMELRKLVYLYVINTSRLTPEDAMMVVNHLRKDAVNKSNPVIRALAIRTMGYIRVETLNEYLVDSLLLGLKDTDPYVRKTAALCIPKLVEISSKPDQHLSLVRACQELLLKESNGLVLANLVTALQEMSHMRKTNFLTLTSEVLQKLLFVLGQLMEWGQVFILDCLATYEPREKEAETIIERVMPRLSHINPTVVLSSLKVIVTFMDYVEDQALISGLCRKLKERLVSLAGWKTPEVQYVVLRNVHYLIERRPAILGDEIKVFFVNYSDPYYIRHQKLQILAHIVNELNFQPLLNELKEYLTDVDPDYVARVIRAIAKIAVRFERSVEKALGVLSRFMEEVAEHADCAEELVDALMVATQHILRKYPSRFNHNNMFGDVIKLMLRASSPEGVQAAVWINGEYAEEIYPQSIIFIKKAILTFEEGDPTMQLQVLTSAVKVFLIYPEDGQEFITPLLELAAQKVLNADVRDRAYFYWRLLAVDVDKTKSILFCNRPNIREEDLLLDPAFVKSAIRNLGLINSIFQKRPEDVFPQSLSQKLNIAMESPVLPPVPSPTVHPPSQTIPQPQPQTVPQPIPQPIPQPVPQPKEIDLLQLI